MMDTRMSCRWVGVGVMGLGIVVLLLLGGAWAEAAPFDPPDRYGDDAVWMEHPTETVTTTVATASSASFDTSYKTGPATALNHEIITYTIVAINSGSLVTDVVLVDPVPHASVYVPGSCVYWQGADSAQPCGPPPTLWQTDIAADERVTTTLSVQVAAGSMGWDLENCATLQWDGSQEQMCVSTIVNPILSSVYLPLVMRSYQAPAPPTPTPTPTLSTPHMILVANPASLPVGDTSTLTATLFAGDGAPMSGIPVTFSTSDPLGSGALTPLGSATDSNGQIRATLRSTVAGIVRVLAMTDSGISAVVNVEFTGSGVCVPYLVAQVSTGAQPHGVALDTAGRRGFVGHAGGITVLDLDSLDVITEVQMSASVYGLAYDPDRDRIWVTHRAADRLVVLDGGTYEQIASPPMGGGPRSVAYNPANARVYVATGYDGGTVNVYRADGMSYDRTLTDVDDPAHIAVNPVTNKIYVTNHANNAKITLIHGDTHATERIYVQLLDAYGVTVDTTRNLIYATSVGEGRLAIIDGATDTLLGKVDIWRSDGRKVPLRVVAVNPNVGAEGHLLVVTSSADGGEDQVLLIPNGWPTLGTPVPLDVASYPLDGVAFDPITDRFWVTSVDSGLVSVIQDGLPICSTPFSRSQFLLDSLDAGGGPLP